VMNYALAVNISVATRTRCAVSASDIMTNDFTKSTLALASMISSSCMTSDRFPLEVSSVMADLHSL
jgi:hypothetical protein